MRNNALSIVLKRLHHDKEIYVITIQENTDLMLINNNLNLYRIKRKWMLAKP